MVDKPTTILLSNVNTSVSVANGSQYLQTLLIFIRYIHPSAEHHSPSRSPGTHEECKPVGQTPNRSNTTLLKCTDKSGDERNGDKANFAPCLALRIAFPSLGLQRCQVIQAETSVRTAPKGGNRRPMRSNKTDRASKTTAEARRRMTINQWLTRRDENAKSWDGDSETTYHHSI